MYFVSPKLATKTVAKIIGLQFPPSSGGVALVQDRKTIFDIVRDPRDAPDYYGSPGIPFKATAKTVGDFESLFFEDSGITLSHIMNGPEYLPEPDSPQATDEMDPVQTSPDLSPRSTATGSSSVVALPGEELG